MQSNRFKTKEHLSIGTIKLKLDCWTSNWRGGIIYHKFE